MRALLDIVKKFLPRAKPLQIGKDSIDEEGDVFKDHELDSCDARLFPSIFS